MIRDTANIIFVALIVVFMGVVLLFYGKEGVTVDSNQAGMTELLRTTVINNRDDSARAERGVYILDVVSFEEDFESLFIDSRNLNSTDNVDFTFDYLADKDSPIEDTASSKSIKAVRVSVLVNDEVEYNATSIIDVKS